MDIPQKCGMFSNMASTGTPPTRKSTSMTLDSGVLAEAQALGINVSRAAEQGILAAIRAEKARLWQDRNAGAIQDYNTWIETSGLPLAEYRKF